MSNVPIDTPDWQRASVSAGKLLATVPSGTLTETVTVPPNIRSLGIFLSTPNATTVTVTGVTSGLQYTAVPRLYMYSEGSNLLYYVGLLSQLDAQVSVQIYPDPGSEWWICGLTDTPVVDVSQLATLITEVDFTSDPRNALSVAGFDGSSYHRFATEYAGRIIPIVPTTGKKSTVASGTTEILAAPTSGEAYYLFGIDVSESGTSTAPCELTDSLGNSIAYNDPPGGGESHSISLNGFRTTGSVSIITTVAATIVLRYSVGP